ncbi:MAG: CoA transferase, partial [Pseudomonadota bacterium]|nr:CoA transferase [Pseudomonadota bacterium]
GYYLTAAILVAINHRKRTSIGQRIDASMMESVAVQLGDAVMEYSANGIIRKPSGNTHPDVGLQGIFKTVDGHWLALTVDSDESFKSLCHILELNKLLDDKRFECPKSRQDNKKDLREIVKDAFLKRFRSTQLTKLQSRGITAAICGDFLETYREPNEQFVARRFMQAINHREAGEHLLPTMPWILKNTKPSEHSPPPCFGEHSQEIFRQELDIDDDEYAELVRLGISGQEKLS